jgi:copper ion binding protein
MMNKTTLNVPDISCQHCKQSIEGAVGTLAGVGEVTVHVPERTVELAFDPAQVSLESIVAAIEGQGYEVAS